MCSAGMSVEHQPNSAVDAAVQTHTQKVIMLRNRNQQLELKLKAKEKLARRAVVGQRAALRCHLVVTALTAISLYSATR